MGTDTGNTKKKEIKNTHTINETATGYEKKQIWPASPRNLRMFG
jgi:hypothetical protein